MKEFYKIRKGTLIRYISTLSCPLRCVLCKFRPGIGIKRELSPLFWSKLMLWITFTYP